MDRRVESKICRQRDQCWILSLKLTIAELYIPACCESPIRNAIRKRSKPHSHAPPFFPELMARPNINASSSMWPTRMLVIMLAARSQFPLLSQAPSTWIADTKSGCTPLSSSDPTSFNAAAHNEFLQYKYIAMCRVASPTVDDGAIKPNAPPQLLLDTQAFKHADNVISFKCPSRLCAPLSNSSASTHRPWAPQAATWAVQVVAVGSEPSTSNLRPNCNALCQLPEPKAAVQTTTFALKPWADKSFSNEAARFQIDFAVSSVA
mmetsp:Transcript_93025/g.266742  ORF Transcript_93025/g.266742 Transcript_93025/m.266742 type:complete len:263 (-) Transcript_93025:605-1393(-)